MNEKIIEELLLYMTQTKDFVLQECPEVVSQIFEYQKIWNWTCAIGSFIALLILISIVVYTFFNPKLDKYDCWTLPSIYGVMGPSLICLAFFVSLFESINTLIQLYLAPKYYLINLILGMKK